MQFDLFQSVCFRSLMLFACVLCFTGCTVSSAPGSNVSGATPEIDLSTEANARPPGQREILRPPSASKPLSATEALLRDANSAIERQQYARASSLAERALRMQPKSGEPYFVLAKTYYFQQRLDLARSFIARAKSLGADNARLIESIARFSKRHSDL